MTERDDLLALMTDQRTNFLFTLTDVDDAGARARTTVSELTLGGLLKHLGQVQRTWLAVIDGTAPARVDWADLDPDGNRMTDADTLPALRAAFDEAAAAFDRAARDEPDLDREITLPAYPWSPPDPVVRTVRHVLWHIFREIAHHSGHADIVREALDGANTTTKMAEAASKGR
ncbi:DinB family protein [Streptomyces sp. NPDC001515]